MDEHERLQKHLLYAGFSVPIDDIKAWADSERTWAEIFADNILVSKSFGWLSKSVAIPDCLRPFLKTGQDQEYDGHGLS